MKIIINPATGKKIFVGGPTYKKLKEDPRYKSIVSKRAAKAKRVGTRVALRKSKHRKSRYTKRDAPFCGPKGGAAKMTYPVGTKKRALNAVSRSVNAPNPKGIRKCATNYAVKKGWMTKTHQKELLEQ
jgi:hypothetical protein